VGEVPRLSTTALVRRLGRRSPASHVLILGVDAPASGVIEATADGNTVLARLNAPPADQVEEGSPRRDVDALRSLTPREVQVLRLLAAGSNRGEIARQLGVRPNTVRTHTQNLYSKLGLHNSVEVVGFAAAHGLMSELTGTDAGSSPTPASTRRSRDGRSAVNPRQRTG
jgi:DNA-binding CsgD family transcriptional regulator